MHSKNSFVKWFSELSNKDISIAGGKGASLAEMYNNKFPVPPGFVITVSAYKYFMEKSDINRNIKLILDETDVNDTSALEKNSGKIRNLILQASMPEEIKNEIFEAYNILDVDKSKFSGAHGGALDILKNSHEPPFVAVRSSATAEDLAEASFAGQQESFLNVKGNENLMLCVKKAFASLFTARAIYYRKKKGFVHEKSYIAVVVQKMIDSQKSGVIFSKNPLTDENSIFIEAVFGLGEGIVSGKISPDRYILNKELEILERNVEDKKIALTRNSSGNTEIVPLNKEISKREVLTGHELKMLGQYARRLEEHYGKPQDIEFAIDQSGIYIVQSRPITTKSKKGDINLDGNVLFSGLAASPGISSGTVKIIKNIKDLSKIQNGNILVTKMTNPDMVVSMQKATAIVTDEGGITSHASIVSREMGIPAVVGTKVATEKLQEGQVITVDGFTGRIIEGKGIEKKIEIKKILPTKTKIKTIVDLPDYALRAAECGAKGVGLVRMEALIAALGKHPLWYIKKDRLAEYISAIYHGIRKISLPFDEVWIRTTDIRSDEYKNLEGAPDKTELNPMLGDHGIRFGLKNQDLLEAEIKAIKELADEYGNKIFGIMLPQVISINEVKETKKIADKIALPENLKFGIMVETPAAVQLIDELCTSGIDFISFGTNDLTQYTLAIDRNNEEVQDLYDEMNPAILNSIKKVIASCKKHDVETSICGQAGSRPEMAEFLVKLGIDSISVNADAAYEVSKTISETEKAHTPAVKEEPSSGITMTRETIINPLIVNAAGVQNQNNQSFADEDIILKQLEDWGSEADEYIPSLEKEEDIPKLNEAIPISSEDFSREKSSGIIEIDSLKNQAPKEIYEKQSDKTFKEEIIKEADENSEVQFGPENEWAHEKKDKQEDEVLDIF